MGRRFREPHDVRNRDRGRSLGRDDRHRAALFELGTRGRALLDTVPARCRVGLVDDVRFEPLVLKPGHGDVQRLPRDCGDGLLLVARDVPESAEPDERRQQEDGESGPELVERASHRPSLDALALVLHLSARANPKPLLFCRGRLGRPGPPSGSGGDAPGAPGTRSSSTMCSVEPPLRTTVVSSSGGRSAMTTAYPPRRPSKRSRAGLD